MPKTRLFSYIEKDEQEYDISMACYYRNVLDTDEGKYVRLYKSDQAGTVHTIIGNYRTADTAETFYRKTEREIRSGRYGTSFTTEEGTIDFQQTPDLILALLRQRIAAAFGEVPKASLPKVIGQDGHHLARVQREMRDKLSQN